MKEAAGEGVALIAARGHTTMKEAAGEGVAMIAAAEKGPYTYESGGG